VKVLYFHQHFSTPEGSSGTRSYEMARQLIVRGHEVTMVCGRYKGAVTGLTGAFKNGRREGVTDGIHVIEYDVPYANAQSFLQRSAAFLRYALRGVGQALRRDYDVLFATSTPLTAGLPGIAAKLLRRKPFVFEVRDLWPELPKAMGVITNPVILWMMSVLEWSSYHSATRLIGLSPGMVEGVVRCGIDASRVSMVPNGCDFDLFTTDSQSERPADVNATDLLAIYSGTHGLANGLEAAVAAAQVLAKRGRDDIKLLLVGDGKLKPQLQQMARDAAPKNTIFLDPVPKRKLVSYLRGADIGMQLLADVPAFYQGTSPNKFFDYISIGLPVLNNYPGWIADMLTQNRAGFAVPPNDPEAFADALEKAAADRTALSAMGRAAKKLAQREFNRKKLADKWVDILETAAKERGIAP
jgi:glycosyltransferase involved in cell wall biosynthesis